MEETGKRECEESWVKDRGSWRSNKMEGRCESDRGRDKVYLATFENEEKTGLKLDRRRRDTIRHTTQLQQLSKVFSKYFRLKHCFKSKKVQGFKL